MAKKNKQNKFKTEDGTIGYYIDQNNSTRQFHNIDGPAFIPYGDWEKREYYIFGNKMSEKEFNQWVKSWKKPQLPQQPELNND